MLKRQKSVSKSKFQQYAPKCDMLEKQCQEEYEDFIFCKLITPMDYWDDKRL